jgi:hypothetical protein
MSTELDSDFVFAICPVTIAAQSSAKTKMGSYKREACQRLI